MYQQTKSNFSRSSFNFSVKISEFSQKPEHLEHIDIDMCIQPYQSFTGYCVRKEVYRRKYDKIDVTWSVFAH